MQKHPDESANKRQKLLDRQRKHLRGAEGKRALHLSRIGVWLCGETAHRLPNATSLVRKLTQPLGMGKQEERAAI